MRAFRPSHFALPEDFGDEMERVKEENVQRYLERAQAGLPLFETQPSNKEVEIVRDSFAI